MQQGQSDPKGAMARLEEARRKVESAQLDAASRDSLLRRIDVDLANVGKYIAENGPRIAQDEHNQQVRQQLDRERISKAELQAKFAAKIEEYNTLLHEQRFAEAELAASQCQALDPENPVGLQIVTESKIRRAYAAEMDIKDRKEAGFLRVMESSEESAIPFDDRTPYVFGDAKKWQEMSRTRAKYGKEAGRKISEREVEIRNKLQTPVSLQFENAPLTKVMDSLAQLAGINLYLDPQGLAEEGVSSDTPISINIPHEIKLENALRLILGPHRLTFIIKNEVLNITSSQARRGEVYVQTYNVADLVVPIPNFSPHGGMGLEGAYRNAMSAVNTANVAATSGSLAGPMAVVASRDGRPASGMIDPNVLAQMSSGGRAGVPSMPVGGGAGNLGGMAQFDPLIDLIEQTIEPDSWSDTGTGQGTIAPFDINLSMVVSNTQEVHEKIVDLLEQLRRMQDLQVTIEVRFITLNDTFFERIGVNFNWKLNDNIDHTGMNFGKMIDPGTPGNPGTDPTRDVRTGIFKEFGPESSVTVGYLPTNTFSADLDIPFSQNSFGLTVPQLSAFDPTAGLTTGFAILSDIEATFLINAAQSDQRTNVLQAPKVTLFNGQQAVVSDMSQSPFVMSVVPYVGDFVAASQPVIVVLNEGMFLTVQAVVSATGVS